MLEFGLEKFDHQAHYEVLSRCTVLLT